MDFSQLSLYFVLSFHVVFLWCLEVPTALTFHMVLPCFQINKRRHRSELLKALGRHFRRTLLRQMIWIRLGI